MTWDLVPGSMLAAVWLGPDDLAVQERPVPRAEPGSLVLKVEACFICGSDLRILREGNRRIAPGRIIGHEVAGQVVEVGDGLQDWRVGDRVSVGADVPCGDCDHCLAGRGNCCAVNYAIGYQFDGGFAEYMKLDPLVVRSGPVRRFGPELPYEKAALAEPLACCLNGFERGLVDQRDVRSCAVFGAGPIGLMLVTLARKVYGIERPIVVEPSALRRERALRLGVDVAIDPALEDPVEAILAATDQLGADLIFTACPDVGAHEQAVAAVATRGVVNLFGGLPASARPMGLLSNSLHYKEAYLTGSHGSTPAQHARALQLIEEGTFDVSDLITDRFELADVHRAFERARSGEAIKVLVEAGSRVAGK